MSAKLSAAAPRQATALPTDEVLALRPVPGSSPAAFANIRLAVPALAGILAPLLALPANNAPGVDKKVVFLTAAQRLASQYGGVALEDINPLTLCLGQLAYVEFHPTLGYGVTLRLVYDGATVPALTVFRTGDMVPSDLIGGQWVPADSSEAAQANIRAYDATIADWLLNEVCRATVGSVEGFYRAVAAGGPFAAPTGPSDANWVQVAAPAPAGSQYVARTVAQAQSLLADNAVQTIRYLILRGTNGDAGMVELFGLAGNATTGQAGQFSPQGWYLAPGATVSAWVNYDVVSDVVTAFGGGGGASFTTETAGGNLVTQPTGRGGNLIGNGADLTAVFTGNSINATGNGNVIGENAAAGALFNNNSIHAAYSNTISGSQANSNSISGSGAFSNSISGNFANNHSISGSGAFSNSISGNFANNHSISGNNAAGNIISSNEGSNHSISGAGCQNNTISTDEGTNNSISGNFANSNTISGIGSNSTISGAGASSNSLTDCNACNLQYCSNVVLTGRTNLTFIACTAAVNSLAATTTGPATFINDRLF